MYIQPLVSYSIAPLFTVFLRELPTGAITIAQNNDDDERPLSRRDVIQPSPREHARDQTGVEPAASFALCADQLDR